MHTALPSPTPSPSPPSSPHHHTTAPRGCCCVVVSLLLLGVLLGVVLGVKKYEREIKDVMYRTHSCHTPLPPQQQVDSTQWASITELQNAIIALQAHQRDLVTEISTLHDIVHTHIKAYDADRVTQERRTTQQGDRAFATEHELTTRMDNLEDKTSLERARMEVLLEQREELMLQPSEVGGRLDGMQARLEGLERVETPRRRKAPVLADLLPPPTGPTGETPPRENIWIQKEILWRVTRCRLIL